MFNYSSSILIHRPIQRVFKFMSLPVNDFQWQYGTLASALIPPRGAARGGYFRSIGHLLGYRNLSTFEITEYEPSRRYGFRSLSGLLQIDTAYRLELVNGSTRVTIATRISAANLARVRGDVLEAQMKGQLKENLAVLKLAMERMR